MPRITNQWSVESTVTDWQKKNVSKYSSFPSLIPRFRTSDPFSDTWGRLPYRDRLNYGQIYSGHSRQDYLGRLKTTVENLQSDKTLQIRWRFDKELPAFSMDFLFLYLSRFGKVESIYQQAVNACLVLFKDHRTAWKVANTHDLGLPYGRLYTKWWNPLPQDKDQLRIMKHVEKASETRSRFHSLMDFDDRVSAKTLMRAGSRAFADGNRSGGPTLKAYLCEGVQRAATAQPEVKAKPQPAKREGVIEISSPEEFYDIVKSDNLVVVDFFATWCGPCRTIAPIIEEFAKQFENVTFVKIDVDEFPEVAEECRISAMPTFLFFKGGNLLETSIGAFADKLKEKIMQLK